jgi:hypothetical protein
VVHRDFLAYDMEELSISASETLWYCLGYIMTNSDTIHLGSVLYSDPDHVRLFGRSIPHNPNIFMVFTQSFSFAPELELQVRRSQHHFEIEVCTIVARFEVVPGWSQLCLVKLCL